MANGWRRWTAEKPRSSKPGRISSLPPARTRDAFTPSSPSCTSCGSSARAVMSSSAGGPPTWQIKYLVGGKWRHESSHTENERDAKALLTEKVFHASAGTLPGTASFDQIIDALVADARVRGRKAARLSGAAGSLKARLAGYRAEDCNYAVWLRYAEERQRDAAGDTVHLELEVAKRAYKLAWANGVVARPRFSAHQQPARAPRLHRSAPVGRGAFAAAPRFSQCSRLRLSVRRPPDGSADAWADVDRESQIVHLRRTKTGHPRSIHHAQWPELAAVMARRAAVDGRLKRPQ